MGAEQLLAEKAIASRAFVLNMAAAFAAEYFVQKVEARLPDITFDGKSAIRNIDDVCSGLRDGFIVDEDFHKYIFIDVWGNRNIFSKEAEKRILSILGWHYDGKRIGDKPLMSNPTTIHGLVVKKKGMLASKMKKAYFAAFGKSYDLRRTIKGQSSKSRKKLKVVTERVYEAIPNGYRVSTVVDETTAVIGNGDSTALINSLVAQGKVDEAKKVIEALAANHKKITKANDDMNAALKKCDYVTATKFVDELTKLKNVGLVCASLLVVCISSPCF
jgi:hypothetical protein